MSLANEQQPSGWPDVFGMTDPGLQHPHNEDHFLVAELSHTLTALQTSLGVDEQHSLSSWPKGLVLSVADGVGGRRGADQASRIAMQTVTSYVMMTMPWFLAPRAGQDDDAVEVLEAALTRANRLLHAFGAKNPSLSGMATTMTMALVAGPLAYVVHAGDSRCYLYREGVLRRLTQDHTVAAEVAEQSQLRLEPESPFAHVLSNVLGGHSEGLRPEVVKGRLLSGDVLLLCTDGLSKHVDDDSIRHVLSTSPTAESATRSLVAGALGAGGSDNVTVITGRF
jgi:protein phosphatase